MFSMLALESFRNHRSLLLEDLPRHVVFCGRNGAGKTNMLEALSLFSAGRGLRNASLDDICPLDSPQEGFFVRAELKETGYRYANGDDDKLDSVQLATSFLPSNKRRRVLIDEQEVSQNALRERVRLCWLVPQMGNFFTDGIGARRTWLDRIVARQDPQHDARLAKQSYALRERLALLLGCDQTSTQGNGVDAKADNDSYTASWLDVLEGRIAEQAVAITASRAESLARLNDLLQNDDLFSELTRIRLTPASRIDDDLQSLDALQAEQQLLERLRSTRVKDRQDRRTNEGAHRARLLIEDIAIDKQGVRAEICSCGEQKLMLVALLVAEALMLMGTADRSSPPILLLDDFPAHLDSETQDKVLRVLSKLGTQCFYTSTEPFTDRGDDTVGGLHLGSSSCGVFLLESSTERNGVNNCRRITG